MNEHMYLSSSEATQEASAGAKERQADAVDRAIIGERVRQARIAAHLTQQELAGDTYSKSYISAVERGKMTPSFQALHILAERLGRSISFFLGEGEVALEALTRSSTPDTLSDEEWQQREQEARHMLKEAEELLVKGKTTEALATLQVETNEPPTALPLYDQPRWYWLAGWAGVWGHKYPEAIGWLEHGLKVIDSMRAQAPGSQRPQLVEMAERIRNFLGVCYYEQRQPATALEHHLRCLAAVTNGTVTNSELKLLIYKSLGNDHTMLGRHKEAIFYYERACKLAEDMNEPRQRGLAYWGLALAYKSSDDLHRAEKAFQEAVDTFERLDDMHLALPLHAVLAQVLIKLNDFPKAERHLKLALETAERLNDAHARGIALGNLAIFHMKRGKLVEAIQAAQEGLNAVKEKDDPRTEGQLFQTLAEAYEASQNVPAAEQAYLDAITTLGHSQEREFLGRVHEQYGKFLAAQSRFEEAYAQMDLAQQFLNQ